MRHEILRDLSRPKLDRAEARLRESSARVVTTWQDDICFTDVDVLHKNGCFAAFGAVKRTSPSTSR